MLGGSGICLQDEGAFEIGAGDCIVHVVGAGAHAPRGRGGLDVLAFGTRGSTEIGHLPRSGVAWIGGTWVGRRRRRPSVGARGRGRRAGVPEVGDAPGERRQRRRTSKAPTTARWKRLAAAAGSQLTGLNWGLLYAGEEGAPPHCHSADEEIFVVLDGEGTLELWPSPQPRSRRPRVRGAPGSGRARHLAPRRHGHRARHPRRRAEPDLPRLRDPERPNDVCYYPRSNKISFRGLGLIGRLEDLDYDDGEPQVGEAPVAEAAATEADS